jgi:cytochrome P450
MDSRPFGHGIHFCLGSLLARLEAKVALETRFLRTRSLSRKAEPLEWVPALQVRGLAKLAVEVLPA